jgi:hypothetical protein
MALGEVLIARVVNEVVPEAGSADVMLWPGYGFVCPRLVTTNGSAWTLLSTLRVWDSPGRDACERWEPVHPDAPRRGSTIEEVVHALSRIAGRAPPNADVIAARVRGYNLDGARLL